MSRVDQIQLGPKFKLGEEQRNSIGVSFRFLLNFMDDKNEVVFVDRDKLQSGKI